MPDTIVSPSGQAGPAAGQPATSGPVGDSALAAGGAALAQFQGDALLRAAMGSVAPVEGAITAQANAILANATAPIVDCGALIGARFAELYNAAKASLDAIGAKAELDSYHLLSAALTYAAAGGCAAPSPGEILAASPSTASAAPASPLPDAPDPTTCRVYGVVYAPPYTNEMLQGPKDAGTGFSQPSNAGQYIQGAVADCRINDKCCGVAINKDGSLFSQLGANPQWAAKGLGAPGAPPADFNLSQWQATLGRPIRPDEYRPGATYSTDPDTCPGGKLRINWQAVLKDGKLHHLSECENQDNCGTTVASDLGCEDVTTTSVTACDTVSGHMVQTDTASDGTVTHTTLAATCPTTKSDGDYCCPQPPQVVVTVNPLLREPSEGCGEGPDEEPCFAGPKIEVAAGGADSLSTINWDDPAACEEVNLYLDKVATEAEAWIRGFLPAELNMPGPDIDALANKFAEWFPPGLRWLGKLNAKVVYGVINWGLNALSRTGGCGDAALAGPMLIKAALEMLQRWTGIETADARQQITYALNYRCPTLIPTVGELHRMKLMGKITYDQWLCLVKASNQLPNLALQSLTANEVKPDVREIIGLWRRDQLNDAELNVRLFQQAVLDPKHRDEFVELSKVIPPYGDLIRLMVRDSFDEDVVAKFKYDDEFNAKFAGKARFWAKAQGIDADVMKYMWRAHWQLPSPTQAFEMLQRNRPDRVAANLVVTRQDVATLLGVNDLAPFWQDRLINVSYRVLRLVDVRKQYNYGVIDRKELAEQLQDRGYDKATADRQSQSNEIDKSEWVMGRKVCQAYAAGTATRQEVEAEIDDYSVEPQERQVILSRLDQRIAFGVRAKCLAAIKRRLSTGEIDQPRAVNEVAGLGFGVGEAVQKVTGWACEMKSKGKEAAAAMLCDWVHKGIIGITEMYQRLMRLGYRDQDATNIISACLIKLKDQKDKADKAAKDAQQRAKDAQQRAKDKAARDKAAADHKQQVPKIKASLDGEKAELKILQASRRWSKHAGVPDRAVWHDLKEKVCELETAKGYSTMGAVALVVQIVLGAIDAGDKSYEARYMDVRASLPDVPSRTLPCTVGASTNGSGGG